MKRLLAVVLFVTLLISFAGVASAADWQFITSDDEASAFFDTQSFTGDKNSKTYTVWIKWQPSEDYIKEFAKRYKKDISYVLIKNQYDSINKKMRFLNFTFYDVNSEIAASNTEQTPWEDIIPKSHGGKVFNATYAYYKEHYLKD